MTLINVYTIQMRLVSLETATREAIHTATTALALHSDEEQGHEWFHMVRPVISGAYERYAAVKEYCRKRMDSDDQSNAEAPNVLFSYRKGVSIDTPCGVCEQSSGEMIVTRPCGHVICKIHRPETKHRCLVCRAKLTSTFLRDSMCAGKNVLEAYYDGFIDEIKYNDWYCTQFKH